ncbi:hypothetical protein [Salimicrobium flavidum]|uniref:Uncharacterized protein n=1 Tax=Salimicrobium flavidum TaxID=570947 RepID=A0A1N7ILU0_9BACI|nr:hypothetical protein [Salimicrobium flavidum]SIS38063.1 hypothetical protein SAMN05421687_101523 [Salimicrobium flavidum]
MRKRWKIALAGAITGGAAAYLMYDDERRTQLTEKVKQLNSTSDSNDMPIREAGDPEADNLQNAKMVSEGSQFGVQYYNELTEKEREILEKSRHED